MVAWRPSFLLLVSLSWAHGGSCEQVCPGEAGAHLVGVEAGGCLAARPGSGDRASPTLPTLRRRSGPLGGWEGWSGHISQTRPLWASISAKSPRTAFVCEGTAGLVSSGLGGWASTGPAARAQRCPLPQPGLPAPAPTPWGQQAGMALGAPVSSARGQGPGRWLDRDRSSCQAPRGIH